MSTNVLSLPKTNSNAGINTQAMEQFQRMQREQQRGQQMLAFGISQSTFTDENGNSSRSTYVNSKVDAFMRTIESATDDQRSLLRTFGTLRIKRPSQSWTPEAFVRAMESFLSQYSLQLKTFHGKQNSGVKCFLSKSRAGQEWLHFCIVATGADTSGDDYLKQFLSPEGDAS